MSLVSLIIPILLSVHSIIEIKIPGGVVKGTPMRIGAVASNNGVLLAAKDYITVKNLVEGAEGVCSYVLEQAAEDNEQALRRAYLDCDETQFDNQTYIELLQAQAQDLQKKLKREQRVSRITRYVAIGLGVVALSVPTYFVVR